MICSAAVLVAAGAEVVIEEFMEGEEASFFVLCDGEEALPLGTAQDHKRVGEGDTGPNTGGMGAYSPAPVMTDEIIAKTMDEIVRPTLREMARRGTPYQGVLFVGLMIKDGAPRLVEYNARFGDPECQVLMMRLGAQAFDHIQAAAEGRLNEAKVHWADDHALTVVMAAKGYPAAYEKGTVIKGLEALPQSSSQMVFHAGTARSAETVTAVGGRVLAVTARADTLEEAHRLAYEHDPPDRLARRVLSVRYRLACFKIALNLLRKSNLLRGTLSPSNSPWRYLRKEIGQTGSSARQHPAILCQIAHTLL